MFKWLERKIQKKAVAEGKVDIQRFVDSLKGQPDDAIGLVIALATITRIHLVERGTFRSEMLDPDGSELSLEDTEASKRVRELIEYFQKEGKTHIATGLMVWLHSLRAIWMPELTYLGQEMWKELQRGFPHAADALDSAPLVLGVTVPPGAHKELEFVPPLLSKIHSN